MQALKDDEIKKISARTRHFLKSSNMSQNALSGAIGVDQPFVSRVLNMNFKRQSPKLLLLIKYINMHLKIVKIPDELNSSISNYLAIGGDSSVITVFVETLIKSNIYGGEIEQSSHDQT